MLTPDRVKTLALATVCFAAVSLCLGCSNDDEMTLGALCIDFTQATPANTPLAAGDGPGSTCNELTLVIFANQAVNGVFSMALDFSYPPVGALDLASIEPAAIWTANGYSINPQYDDEPFGSVTLSISRVNPNPGMPDPGFNVVPGQVLATLSFDQIAGSGGGNLTFVSGSLLSGGIPPVALAEVPDDTVVGTIGIVEQ